MNHYYTDERNAQIVIALMKAHNIRKVVASPGATNICFVASIQQDPYFEIYSSVDERSAAYIACGLAAESGEPVAISCTGATSSRNYMPALTEAFYRKLPILAITSSRRSYRIGHNIDQVTDRTLLPRDVAKLSVQMPLVYDMESEWACVIAANKAMLELRHHGGGPVHINLETDYSQVYNVEKLPEVRAIYRVSYQDEFPAIQANRVAIMVGAHIKWSDRLSCAVEKFCELYNAIVLCDHTSNYKGKYRVFSNLLAQQKNYSSVIKNVDLMIHIGDISASNYDIQTKAVWRVNPDGELRDTYKALRYVFEMEEEYFFVHYGKLVNRNNNNTFYPLCVEEDSRIRDKIPELPFSNAWLASQTTKRLPEHSVLHLGILNSLRTWNFYDIPTTCTGYANTGGFGIDGSLSTVIGAALADKSKLYFCVLGDLAFFYDLNSLGNRHVGNNIRILLINNGRGTEFRLQGSPGAIFGDDVDTYISAAGHYGNKSPNLVKHYAQDLGFEYLAAFNKESYQKVLDQFIDPASHDKPMILEVFIDSEEESKALSMMCRIETDRVIAAKNSAKNIVKEVLRPEAIKKLKKFIEK